MITAAFTKCQKMRFGADPDFVLSFIYAGININAASVCCMLINNYRVNIGGADMERLLCVKTSNGPRAANALLQSVSLKQEDEKKSLSVKFLFVCKE